MSNATVDSVGPLGPLSVTLDFPNSAASSLGKWQDCGFSTEATKIMIVDDEALNIDLLRLYLEDAGFEQFVAVTDASLAIDTVQREKPDVLLLDLNMPKVNGFDILASLRRDEKLRHLPVIILTASTTSESKTKALELGATDFLGKPVDSSELILRLRNTLTAKAFQDHLQDYSTKLERQVSERTEELEEARREAMFCLARAAEFRDDDTGRHVMRVGKYAALIARRLGFDSHAVEMLEQAGQLHDVGKIGISDTILLKPGKLEPSEFDMMKKHCEFGRKIIQPMTDTEWKVLRDHTDVGAMIMQLSSSPVMKMAAVIAQTHHEKWDGSGYPRGLSGEAIPIEGRIIAVADVYDALSSRRPYKPAFPRQKCFAILEEGRGRHFDPRVLDAFFVCSREIEQIQAELADPDQ